MSFSNSYNLEDISQVTTQTIIKNDEKLQLINPQECLNTIHTEIILTEDDNLIPEFLNQRSDQQPLFPYDIFNVHSVTSDTIVSVRSDTLMSFKFERYSYDNNYGFDLDINYNIFGTAKLGIDYDISDGSYGTITIPANHRSAILTLNNKLTNNSTIKSINLFIKQNNTRYSIKKGTYIKNRNSICSYSTVTSYLTNNLIMINIIFKLSI